MEIPSFASSFAGVPLDALVILGIIAIITLYSSRAGILPAISLSLALPLALSLVPLLASTAFLGAIASSANNETLQAGVFIAAAVIFTMLIQRTVSSFDDTSGFRRALMAGTASAIVLTVVWLRVPALASLWDFGSQVEAIFGAGYALWWLIAAYVVLGFARR
jgi:hypothetical protein